MNKQRLKSVMERVENWPEAEQEELLAYALEIEARHEGTYNASPEELRAIDEVMEAVRRGELATDEEVEAVFASAADHESRLLELGARGT